MSEHQAGPPPERPSTGEGANSYGTDDPARQAEIERTRAEASAERRRNRERLEQLVETGMSPDDAEALIEFEDAQIETGEEERRTSPRIYVASLVDLNDGNLDGGWIEADQEPEEIEVAIQRLLARSEVAAQTGEPAEEWAITDYEGFGRLRLDMYASLETVAQLGQGIAQHGLAFAAWAEANDSLDEAVLERFGDRYHGIYASREAYAEEYVQEVGYERNLLDRTPAWLRQYVRIDYGAIARDWEASGTVRFVNSHDGQVWVFGGDV